MKNLIHQRGVSFIINRLLLRPRGTCLCFLSGILTIGGNETLAVRHTPAVSPFRKFGSSASVFVKPNEAEQTESAQ